LCCSFFDDKNTMSIWKTFLCAMCSVLFVTGHSSTAAAQALARVNHYGATPFLATWTDISMTADTFHYNKVDQGWGTIAMPFDFPYDDSIVPAGSTIRIGASGVIALSTDTTPNVYALGNPVYPGLVCIFSALVVEGTGKAAADSDFFEVDGASPNRVLTVQYHFMHMPGTGSGGGGGGMGGNSAMMQVKFHETSGVIEFIYLEHNSPFEMDLPGIDTINFGGVGLNGFSKPSFVSTTYETHLIATPDSDVRWTPETAGVMNEAAATTGFALGSFYPNPANNTAQIPVTLQEQGTIRCEVRDASGALMKTNSLGTMSAGDHTITLDIEDLPSGTYFCTITCGNAQVTRQMTIIR
jgi:hypothetical protein